MTVLALLWNHDGRPAAGDCRTMLHAQCVSGVRNAICDGGAIALGKAPLHGLAAGDTVDGAAGALTLIADARLDNGADLSSQLGLAAPDSARLSDARLMMLCFERWGDRAVDLFVGDFALALWDRRSERLLLARDFAGQRPLYFHETSRALAAASTAKGLHALDFIPRAVNQRRMLEMLAALAQEGRTTFFEGIERVEPGEALTFRRSRRASRIFWTPPTGGIRLRTPADYAEGLLEKLDSAVVARLRGSGGTVGTHLSAGLDSSAVTSSAALRSSGRVVAFTSVPSGRLPSLPEGRFGNEAALAAETAAMYSNVEHRLIPAGTRIPLEDLGRELRLFERPDLNLPNLVWSNRINDAAQAAGIHVMLTGTMGNATISYDGAELLGDLLARGRIGRFFAECFAARGGSNGAKLLLGASARNLLPRRIVRLLRRLRYRNEHPAHAGVMNLSAPGAAAILAAFDRSEDQVFGSSAGARMEMIGGVDWGSYNKGVLTRWNIDLRDPTVDRRLVEFCLQVPMDQYFRDGMQRALIRNALAGRVSESVRCNRRRGLQAANWFSLLSAARPEARRILDRIGECRAARDLIDMGKMHRLLENWPEPSDGGAPVYRAGFLRGLSVGEFIRIYSSNRTAGD